MKGVSAKREGSVFYEMPPSSREKLLSCAHRRKYQKGAYLFQIREEVTNVYIVISGYAVIERIGRSQGKRALFLLGEGEAVNEVVLERTQASVSCYALTDLEVFCIPSDRMLRLMEQDASISRALFDSMAKKLRRMYHQAENTTKMTKLKDQISSRLWKLGRDFGISKEEYLELPFKITITFLAELVGSNRESVSRIVKELTEEGMISINHGECRIYSMDRLKK